MKIPILCGPTASGKSAFALQLAQKIGGEIISCDSAQIYRECDIVTAKPTRQERESVPHHLLDICNPNERFSAMLWAHAAAKTASEIVARGKIPVICGGTGFYLRALLQPENLAAPALGAVGYKQLLPVLENPARLPEAVAVWKQARRNYAKRQMTWFRHQTPAIWLDARCEISEILQQIQ